MGSQNPHHAVVRCVTLGHVSLPKRHPTDVSVRQFVVDSGTVTRGLRQGRPYVLTLNGEPLAQMIPIRRRRSVPKDEALAIFATAPLLDAADLRDDLDATVEQDLRDPYEGTDL
jgi:antitoxin (DNA-binding transcriptional repressor) of toxin-antitoxin stability system